MEINMKTENTVLEYHSTRLERLGWYLFPNTLCDMPDKPGMRDCLVTRTKVELSFVDRLRVLVSGRIQVETKTATKNVVGAQETNAAFVVKPPAWMDPHSP